MKEQKSHYQEKRVFIVGDSATKNVNSYEILRKLKNCKVYVRPCYEATIRSLEDHVKLTLRENPDEIFFSH